MVNDGSTQKYYQNKFPNRVKILIYQQIKNNFFIKILGLKVTTKYVAFLDDNDMIEK